MLSLSEKFSAVLEPSEDDSYLGRTEAGTWQGGDRGTVGLPFLGLSVPVS